LLDVGHISNFIIPFPVQGAAFRTPPIIPNQNLPTLPPIAQSVLATVPVFESDKYFALTLVGLRIVNAQSTTNGGAVNVEAGNLRVSITCSPNHPCNHFSCYLPPAFVFFRFCCLLLLFVVVVVVVTDQVCK
jgi:hypothetical protein